MPQYTIEVTRTQSWHVTVEADDDGQARHLACGMAAEQDIEGNWDTEILAVKPRQYAQPGFEHWELRVRVIERYHIAVDGKTQTIVKFSAQSLTTPERNWPGATGYLYADWQDADSIVHELSDRVGTVIKREYNIHARHIDVYLPDAWLPEPDWSWSCLFPDDYDFENTEFTGDPS